jgi:hypothetical protein
MNSEFIPPDSEIDLRKVRILRTLRHNAFAGLDVVIAGNDERSSSVSSSVLGLGEERLGAGDAHHSRFGRINSRNTG